MPQLLSTDQRKNARIERYDLIKSVAYDRDMIPLAEIYNSGFNTTLNVIKHMKAKIFPDKLYYVRISNDSKGWMYLYNSSGKRVNEVD